MSSYLWIVELRLLEWSQDRYNRGKFSKHRGKQFMQTKEMLLKDRDAKAKPHLEQYAPVWIIAEKIIAEDEAVQFNVVFFHNLYGWVNRRYRYDGFNNVLYHKGQTIMLEDDVVEIQEREPYISTAVTDMPNAYGG